VLAELEPLASSYGAYVFAVVLGLLWGSFANVCIYRWAPSKEYPKGRSVVAPGSHCFACKAPVRWYDNVPLLSWLWLRGKCRSCKAPFSARYLIVEALVAAMFGFAWWMNVTAGVLFEPFEHRLIRFAVSCAFCFTMVVIAFIDIDTKTIVHRVWSVLVFYALSLAIGQPWWSGLVGAAIGYALPWAISEIYVIVTEREGLGLGDGIVLAIVGALLGWRGVAASLFLGSLSGSIIGVMVLMRGEPPKEGEKRSRAGAVVAVGAVVSTVLATITGLRGSYAIAGACCVAALACLVISRKLEPPIDEEEESEEVALPQGEEAAPTRTPAMLAMASAGTLVGAVALTLLRYPIAAGACAAVGVALLFVARRLFYGPQGPQYVDGIEEPAPATDAPSLMRTEVPFGPFLAIGAVFYLFAEPWIVVQFSLL
jgi:leader peptidase (prepilin peptidase)/N-methyltransferase